MNRTFKSVAVLAILVLSTAIGQDLPMRGPARERVEQFKKIRMMEVMKLDEETSIRFFARYNKHQDSIKDITAKRDELIDQLAALRKSDGADSEYERVFKELQSIESQIVGERSKFLQDMKGVVSARQVAEYIVFERNFNRQLMQLMREMAQERGRGRMGPPLR
ncbi:MAG: hypothetical protein HYY49_00405 [Ignavibacteriales bacterium]|nr:hypothetical protein [Ignavibacteriales bacterium]